MAAARRRRGGEMTLTLKDNPIVSVAFRMTPLVPSGTGRMSAHSYCTTHRDHQVSSTNDPRGKWCTGDGGHECETFMGYDCDGKIVEVSTRDLAATSDKMLTLSGLVDSGAIDPLYFERSFVLEPGDNAVQASAFDQLVAGLKASGMWATGTAVLNKSTKAVVLRWSDRANAVIAHSCTYDARVDWDVVQDVVTARAARPEIADDKATGIVSLLQASLEDEFDFSIIEDTFAKDLDAAVVAAAAGLPAPIREEAAAPAPVGDLMAALQQAVAQKTAAQKKKPAAKKPARDKVAA